MTVRERVAAAIRERWDRQDMDTLSVAEVDARLADAACAVFYEELLACRDGEPPATDWLRERIDRLLASLAPQREGSE
ncbi:MAG TPA: hypothetical protein VD931_17625 [Baekduia sp.]|nr:hypothetical protein [Baekduia sp.]